MGLLARAATRTGVITWSDADGFIASVGFGSNTLGVPFARFSYTHNGKPVTYDVALRWKNSNLNTDTSNGYYYFVCPVTGSLCRNLYFVDGRFVSRQAFKALYPAQVESHRNRERLRYWRDVMAADDLANDRYRRETYRGRLTPYGRKIEKITRHLEQFADTSNGLTTRRHRRAI